MWAPSQESRPWLRLYPEDVPVEPEVPDVPVTRLLDDAARRHPRRSALWFAGRRTRYRALRDAADRFAAGLERLGVLPGDRVAVLLPNCPQQVVAVFGTWRRGAVVVLLDPLAAPAELRHRLTDSGARVAVVLDRCHPALRAVRRDVRLDHVVVASLYDALPLRARVALRLPGMRARRARVGVPVPDEPGVVPFRSLVRRARGRAVQHPLDPATDLAAIQYTSGTEGRPKGAMCTHRNLVANAVQEHAWDVGGRDVDDTTLALLPLFHSFGLTSCLVAPVMKAGTIVLLPRLDLGRVVRALRRHRPTVFPGVPTLYDQVLDVAGPADLASVRVFISGASGLRRPTIARIDALGGHRLIQCYGLTEASPALTANPPTAEARNETVGLPLPLTDAVVVDRDEPTRVLPPGEPGELVVRGPQVFRGYWNQPLATARALSRGWLRTGDIAIMDAAGFVTILERRADLIKVSGFSVLPSEVEEVLREHPAVLDCAVVGVPDPRRGERVVAYVVEHPAYPFSADELRRHCARRLTRYKVPREFRPRSALPRDALGKVLRRELRAAARNG
ncbi:AMP-binding protein [Actinomadura flavalba]|uniref:AMP-binding protein n=1 Tax=Actinomadura flavalba TaxID=1120938 RepID=UPI0003618DD8|nr:AMP-binding protein [Actinomadura flavalba]